MGGKKLFYTVILGWFCVAACYAQPEHCYWVKFKDKSGTPYSVSNPSAFLSQRAIDRRTKAGIAIDYSDLPVNPAYVQAVLGVGVTLRSKSKWLNGITVSTDDSTHVDSMLQMPFIQSVDRSYIYKTNKKTQIDKKFATVGKQLNEFDYGVASDQIEMVGGEFLHESGHTGKGMWVGVFDSGFNSVDQLDFFDHLRKENRILHTWDFVNLDNSVYDEHSHGLNVLSVMAARKEGRYVGAAPDASYVLIRTENVNSEYVTEEDNWVAAAELADSMGVDVINSSLGYTDYDDTLTSHIYDHMDGNTARITRGADFAAAKGMLVVNSAGNSGGNSWHFIGAPADGDSVLAVGAVGLNENVAPFSSRGPTFDSRIKPNVCGLGWGTAIIAPAGDIFYGNGTSFSSPLIAGLAASLWSAFPEKSGMEIKKAIEESSHKYKNPDSDFGYGIPNFINAFLSLNGTSITDTTSNHILSAFPNPFSNRVQFVYYSAADQIVNVELIDAMGKRVYIHSEIMKRGEYKNFKIEELISNRSGIYVLRIVAPTGNVTHKLSKW